MRVARHKTTFLGWLGVWLVVGLVGSSSLLHWDRAWNAPGCSQKGPCNKQITRATHMQWPTGQTGCSARRPAPATPCEHSSLANRRRTLGDTPRVCGGGTTVLGGGLPPAEAQQAWPLAPLPAVYGGLDLQSAERTAPAAHWAAWMDALPVIRCRLPGAAAWCLEAVEQGAEGTQRHLCRQKAGKRASAGTLPTKASGRNNPAMQAGRVAARLAVSRDAEPSLSRPRVAAGS